MTADWKSFSWSSCGNAWDEQSCRQKKERVLEGYRYTFADIVKVENHVQDSRQQTETVTVETSKNDLGLILEKLAPTLDYDDGQYCGKLALDHTSIYTEAAGYTTRSYNVTETKTIGQLDRNDMSYVPATTVKDGRTLKLSNVEWQVTGTDLVKEPIEDASMTFEELRIRKSEDFADLEEGKYVSWSVEYCGIRKEIKDPKGTSIISVKETIERSHEFLDALKKSKDKNPDCFVKPRVVMKTKGIAAAYKGRFANVEEARNSNKVICLIPSCDGRIYEMRKTEQGEFIAPKYNVAEFQQVRAGFTPALPKIPLALIGQLTAFFRSFMEENEEYEAMAQIYWDKEKQEFFAYVPKQSVSKMEIEADLRECPYNDEERYLCYADIHSHNSMEAFFSATDDMDERGTGLYFVVGELDGFFPSIEARISCGGSFVSIDPRTVIEDLEQAFPTEWKKNVTCRKKKIREKLPAANLGGWKKEFES